MQVQCIRSLLAQRSQPLAGRATLKAGASDIIQQSVQVNTVDSFQGETHTVLVTSVSPLTRTQVKTDAGCL